MFEDIKVTLERAIAAHQKGQLNEAERLYRAILQLQPPHAHANHNLGVLQMSLAPARSALPMFKNALEADPTIEQFWISYISALIEESQIKEARKSLASARKQGFDLEKLSVLDKRLKSKIHAEQAPHKKNKQVSKAEKNKRVGAIPSVMTQNQLSSEYQNGQLEKAKSLALWLTERYPDHPFAWKILGAILKQTGQTDRSLPVMRKSVQLSPEDAEAHKNLGDTLQDLGKLHDAKQSYEMAIKLRPDYAHAYINLGIALHKLGKLKAAEAKYTQAVFLDPSHSDLYNNLGNLQQELGKLDDAQASYAKAVKLKPNDFRAHSNLGAALEELGRFGHAETSYLRAIKFNPDYPDAHNNLGSMLQKLGRLEEAEDSLQRAINLDANYAEAHNNMGIVLKELGRLEEAEASYRKALILKPDFVGAMFNRAVALGYSTNVLAEIEAWQAVALADPTHHGLRARVNLGICKFLERDFSSARRHLAAANGIQKIASPEYRNERVFQQYLSEVLKRQDNGDFDISTCATDDILYVIGESHSLVSHRLRIRRENSHVSFVAKLIKGCMQWHLGKNTRNQYKAHFEKIFETLPRASSVLLSIGEIDCRLDSGVIKHKAKSSEKTIEEIVAHTIDRYLNYVSVKNRDCRHSITIQGVPCPNIEKEPHSDAEISELIETIMLFNCELKVRSLSYGFGFLDLHELTDRGDGFSNGLWHVDYTHLTPEAMLEAWNNHYIKPN